MIPIILGIVLGIGAWILVNIPIQLARFLGGRVKDATSNN